MAGICEMHRRFVAPLTDDLLWVEDPGTGEHHRITPGELRRRDVAVGRHVPVSPGAVPRFLAAFERAYAATRLGWVEAILAAPAAHHRIVWIHPCLDGNGRIARLMAHAMLIDALGEPPLWSVSRALARNKADYMANLSACDLTRRNDLDGRGHLSEEALAAFTALFLQACIDEIRSMSRSTFMDEVRAAGRAITRPGPTAARRQDTLYGDENGLP